jgi:hypothetical protein
LIQVPNPLNLRDEFLELLTDTGFYVLLQRQSKKIHCSCWNEKYQEGKHDCTLCGGTGWVVRIERHLTRNMDANIPVAEPTMNQVSNVGRSAVQLTRWYFMHDVHPQIGDMIYEVTWDPKNPHKPTGLVAAHMINQAYAKRGDHGRIEYWSCAARSETINNKVRNIIVRSMGPIKNYVLVQ